jgi:hypothetical protein
MTEAGIDSVIDRVQGDKDYIKFLLVEAPYIRSALYARGMQFDPEYATTAYPTTIGNALHCDLIELEAWLSTQTRADVQLLLAWASHSPRSSRTAFSKPKIRRAKGIAERAAEHLEAGDDTEAS